MASSLLALNPILVSTGTFLILNSVCLVGLAANAKQERRSDNLRREIIHYGRVYAEIDYWASLGYEYLQECRLQVVDERYKHKVLERLSETFPVTEVSFETMLSVVTHCQDLQRKPDKVPSKTLGSVHGNATVKNKPLSIWTLIRGIVPGTKWCGYNDIAANYHELGEDFELDKCCRAHDHCPIKIKAFSENFGVRNFHPYTKSHCACDDLFYDCLKRAQTSETEVIAPIGPGPGPSLAAVRRDKLQSIGNLFFNVLGLQCAEPDRSRVCVEYRRPGEAGGGGSGGGANSMISWKSNLLGGLMLKLFGAGADVGVNGAAAGGTATPNDEELECARWQEDVSPTTTLKFRSSKRKF